jgi:hypothetical protein
VRLGWEAPHVAYGTQDRRGQDGTHAEDLCEAGAGGVHLGFDARVEVSYLPVQHPDSKRSTSEANRRRRRSEAQPRGFMPRRMRGATAGARGASLSLRGS